MKDMIYYPGFETRNENWLKFALLYFDVLRPIIPYTTRSESTYLSENFQRVMGETDLIEPYRPNYTEGTCASILACEEFEKYLRAPERYRSYFSAHCSVNLLEKWRSARYQDCTLFEGKYSHNFFEYCIENRLATPCHEGIKISYDLAFVYMSLLADIIAKQNEYEMITDVKKYSDYLISKDLLLSKKKQSRIEALQNNITLELPANLTNIPLEAIIDLRKSNSFNDCRIAYLSEIDKLLECKETGKEFSLQKMLSYKTDFVKISERFLNLTASVVISAVSFYSLASGHEESLLPALASAVIDFQSAKDACRDMPAYIENIKTKHLARKYIASLEKLNSPTRSGRWW